MMYLLLLLCQSLYNLVLCVFSSWDEWVPESRVLKYVDSNLQKQKELQRANQWVFDLYSRFTSLMVSSCLTVWLRRLHPFTACFWNWGQYIFTTIDSDWTECVSFLLVILISLLKLCRDHYVEGRMRGAAPNKKIPTAPQKNDVWVPQSFATVMGSYCVLSHAPWDSESAQFEVANVIALRQVRPSSRNIEADWNCHLKIRPRFYQNSNLRC